MKAEIGLDVNKAAEWLMDDMPVAIPTETVYGLAANAFSESAVIKVFDVEGCRVVQVDCKKQKTETHAYQHIKTDGAADAVGID